MAVQYRKPVDDDIPWEQRLVNYAKDQNAGKNEYARALEVFRSKSALGDTAGAESAQKWAGQVRTATGEDAFNEVKSGLTGLMNRQPNADMTAMQQALKQRISQPVQQFSYNPQTDPQYQNALQAAQQGAQTATNNALVQLGRRGIGNSSSATTQAAGIQQNAIGRVNSEILPQLMSQAYQRYMGQQQLENQQLGDMFKLYGTYADQDNTQYRQMADALGLLSNQNQNEFNNNRQLDLDAENKKMNNAALAQWFTQQYGIPVQAKNDYSQLEAQVQGLKPLGMREYEDRRSDNAWERDFKTTDQKHRQLIDNQQMGISRQNANTSAYSAQTSRMNANRQNESATNKSSEKASSYQQNPSYAEDLTFIYENPGSAVKSIQDNVQALISEYGQDGYNALLKEAQRVQKAAQE